MTKRCHSLPICVLALAAFAEPVYALEIYDIGVVPDKIYTLANDISGDGSVILVTAPILMADFRGFVWTASGGIEDMGLMAGTKDTTAFAISRDGSTVVGYGRPLAPSGKLAAFKWTKAGFVPLNGLFSGEATYAGDVSADGSVVVGFSSITGASTVVHAVRWVAGSYTEDLGVLSTGTFARGDAVSDDGSVVAGTSATVGDDDATDHAFRWVAGVGANPGTMTDLGTLTYQRSETTGISADGSVVVGFLGNTEGAFRWTEAGGMIDLGYLEGGSTGYAYNVSPDGSIVVGQSDVTGGATHAFMWTEADHMVDLGTLTGGTDSAAYAVSADNTMVVGGADDADGMMHAVVWTSGAIIDTTNTSAAIAQTAANTQAYFDQRSAGMAALVSSDCDTFGANGVCVSLGGRFSSTQDDLSEQAAVLTVGYRLSDTLRLGAFVDQGNVSGAPDTFGFSDVGPSYGAFAAYSAQADGKGLQSRLSGAWQSGSVDIARALLTDTEAGQGQADVTSSMMAAELGYGLAINPTLIATPFAGWRSGTVTRAAYAETASDTVVKPVSYEDYEQKQSTAILGARLNAAISDTFSLRLNLGGEFDLTTSSSDFSGSSEIPGLTGFALTQANTPNEIRLFGSAGVRYDLGGRQRLSAAVLAGNQSDRTTNCTVMAGYQIGF
ncbi:MAG: autotransporter domain-containing protein [Pseudomonadota bacterium]